MKIRDAHNADAPAIRDLVFGILQSYGLSPDPAGTDQDLDDIEQSYVRGGGSFAVLVERGEIVGCYGLWRVDDQECELRKMYLGAAHRGKGLGRRLLEHACQKAGDLGFVAMRLETAAVLKEAIALYRKFGFEPYCATHLSARCDQAYRKIIKPPGPEGRVTR